MSVTYKALYDAALSQIKLQCVNVSQFSNIPALMKSGAVHTQTVTESSNIGSMKAKAVTTIKWTINNPVQQVSAETVENEFEELMAKYNVTPSSSIPNAGGLYQFYCALVVFCQAKVKVACSPLVSTKYLIYDVSGGYQTTNIPAGDGIAYAGDVALIINDIIRIIGANTKGYQVKYTETVTATV
jgi:hypothetical protein